MNNDKAWLKENAEKFYEDILERYTQEDPFDAWTEYRNSVTEYILNNTCPNTSLAILGAGMLNDIDLKRISTHFSKIVLFDNNYDYLTRGVEKYGQFENVERRLSDFVGITDRQYWTYIIALFNYLKDNNIKGISEEMAPKAKELYDFARDYVIDLGDDTFDNIAIIGVHSQLCYKLSTAWDMICKDRYEKFSPSDKVYSRDFSAKLLAVENEAVEWMIQKLNGLIMQKADSRIIAGHDLYIWYYDDLYSSWERVNEPMGGTRNSVSFFEKRMRDHELKKISEKELMWNLSKDNHYTMCLECMEKQ